VKLLAAQTVFLDRLCERCLNAPRAAPAVGAALDSVVCENYGQVTAISNGLVMGCIGLAMSTPVAVPLMV
jgi:hypothetical protein